MSSKEHLSLNTLIVTIMGIIRTSKGWGKQFEGIIDGDLDRFLEGVADEALGIAGTVGKWLLGAPDVDTSED